MDLPFFLSLLQERGDLLATPEAVDPNLEIAALCARAVRDQGPALLFSRPIGSRFPILGGAFASLDRTSLALGMAPEKDGREQFGSTAHALLQKPEILNALPLPVQDRPACQERIYTGGSAHFRLLPQVMHLPGDAGPCLTAAVVVTRHPETGRINAGIYRIQIIDETRAVLGWHPGSDAAEHHAAARRLGRPLEVAMALGAPPAVTLAAAFPLPRETDEFRFAASFCRQPLDMASCALKDLAVPAASQFVLEGYADPVLTLQEGPFGNHTGRLTSPRQGPVFYLQALTHAADPVFQVIAAGLSPSESGFMAKAFEPVLRRQVTARFAEIRDLCLPLEGVFQNVVVVSVAPDCPNPLDLLAALPEIPCLRRFRFLVAVDESVDVDQNSQVIWRIGNCVDPGRDIRTLDGPLAPWHDSDTPGRGLKMLVDATLKKHHTPVPGSPDPDFDRRIRAQWRTIRG